MRRARRPERWHGSTSAYPPPWRRFFRASTLFPAPPDSRVAVHRSTETDCAAARLVDMERYPILDFVGGAGRALLETCRAQIAELGACELPGFLRPEATARMAREAEIVAPRAHRHAGKATPYLEVPDPGWPEDHPRRLFDPFSLGAVAYDHIPADHALRVLYEWDGLLGFLSAALAVPAIHRYADPLGACNVAVMEDGDCLEWHFDQTDFVVSLALQDAEDGGDFEVAPRVRSADDEHYDAVAEVLRGESACVRRIPMTPGTLLLFQGRDSIHRVTPIRGETSRLVALLSYDTKPGTCASELLQLARYGRTMRPT